MTAGMKPEFFWDELAEEYDPQSRLRRLWTKPSVWKRLFEEAIGEADIILDVGCGAGAIALPLAERPRSIYALDISRNMLKLAKKRADKRRLPLLGRIFFIRADSHYLPFRSNTFDAVYARFSLWPLEDPRKAVEEMVRVTKVGGRVAIVEVDRVEKDRPKPSLKARILYKIYRLFVRTFTSRKDTSHVWKQLKETTRGKFLVDLENVSSWLLACNCAVVKVDREIKSKTSTLLGKVIDEYHDYFLLVGKKVQ